MKLVEAVFHRFTPFTLANIKTFTVGFDSLLQVLNSTNGSGKSAFLSQLNLFPLDKSMFFPDGYKAVTVQCDDGCQYRFHSDAKGHNSCIKTDTAGNIEELNPGGTQKIQLHLAKEITGVTPFIWDIITGVTKFTTADKTTRRQWMELISGMNFDYAFEVHKRLLKAISERKGVIKMSSNHLAEESLKLLEDEQRNKFQLEMEDLTTINRELLRLSGNSQTNIQQLVRKIKSDKEALNTLFNKIRRFKRHENLKTVGFSVEDLVDVSASIGLKQQAILHSQDTLKLLNDQLSEKQELHMRLKRTDGYNLERVTTLQQQGDTRRKELLAQLSQATKWVFNPETPSTWLQRLEEVKGIERVVFNWKERYSALESLSYPYPKSHYDQQQGFANELIQKIGRGEALRQSKEEQLHHLNHTEDVNCPQCKHSFKPNIPITAEEITNQIQMIDRKLKTYQDNLEQMRKEMQEYKTVDDALTELHQFFRQGSLTEVQRHLNFEETSPLAIINLYANILRDESAIHELLEVERKLDQLKLIALELEAREGMGSEESLGSEVVRLEAEISKHQTKVLELQDEVRQLTTYLKAVTQLEEMYLTLIRKTEEHLKDKATLRDALGDELIHLGVDKMTSRIGQLTTVINDDRVLRGITEDLTKQIQRYQEELKGFQTLEKALNPTTGLIGDQLRECTSAFATQLTKVVNRIWNYKLEVLPCSAENIKGMDYKFPMQTEGYMKPPVPDVSKGSKSQKAIIDLGVQLTTRVALELTNMPLYLDEAGDGLDNSHQSNLIEFIRDLLKEYDCNTLLVHHDVGLRSKLGDHQMIVFEPSNVVVPDVYNEHVEIVTY